MSLSAILQPNNIYDLYARSFNGAQFNGVQGNFSGFVYAQGFQGAQTIVGGDIIYHSLTQDNLASSVAATTGEINTIGQITADSGFFTAASLTADVEVNTGVVNAVDGVFSGTCFGTQLAGVQGNIGGDIIYGLSGAPSDGYVYPVSSTPAFTLSAQSVTPGQIISCSSAPGGVSLPSAVGVLALINNPQAGQSYTFLFVYTGVAGGFAFHHSADNTFGIAGATPYTISNNSSRLFQCVILDPTGVVTPSIITY